MSGLLPIRLIRSISPVSGAGWISQRLLVSTDGCLRGRWGHGVPRRGTSRGCRAPCRGICNRTRDCR
jgi:hypothetical protein